VYVKGFVNEICVQNTRVLRVTNILIRSENLIKDINNVIKTSNQNEV